MESHRKNGIALVAILLTGAALRFSAIGYGGSFLTYQADERFFNVTLPFSLSWTDLDPRRFYYPALFWYLLFALNRLIFRLGREFGLVQARSLHRLFAANPIPYFLIARSVSATLGTATVGVTYRLGRRLYSSAEGLLAAGFLAVAFLHVRDSALATVDAPATFFVVLCLLGAAGVLRSGDRRSYVFAAVAGGLATATKYNAVLVLMAVGAAHWLRLSGDRHRRDVAVWIAPLLGVLAISAAVFLLLNPYLALDWRTARPDLVWELEYQGTGQFLDLGRGWPYHLTVSLRYGIGIVLLSLALLGMTSALVRTEPAGLMLFAFAATFFLVMGHSRAVFVRYMVPLVPVLCTFAAVTVLAIARRVASPAARGPVVALLALAAVAEPLDASLAYGSIMRRADTRVKAYEFVRSELPTGTPIASYGLPIIWKSTLPSLEVVHWEKYNGERWEEALRRLKDNGVRYFLTHRSPLKVFSGDIPELEEALRRSATQIAEFDFADRASGFAPDPVYDVVDGFYLPIGGFRGVERPGPLVSLYRLD